MSTQNLASAPTTSRALPTASTPELDTDAHGVFRRHRQGAPFIHRTDGVYLAIRAADVQALITDPRTRQVETDFFKLRGITSGPILDVLGESMLYSNDAVHRRRRSPMSRAFAFRVVTDIRPRIRAVADKLIDDRLGEGQMNLVNDYTALIPALTVADILGLPDEDVPAFTRRVYSFSRALSPSFTPADLPDIQQAGAELLDYVGRLVADRSASPRDDFLTGYVRAVEEAGELSPAEIISQVVVVIIGGSDTTRAAMAIQTALLLEHGEWEAVCADPSLIPGVVSESLRYEPPVGSVPRFTLADIEIDGFTVPANKVLTLSTIAAMRDPALYADPDSFDIRRTDHPRWHLVFGGGAHRCLGEALARAELEEGLAALAARLPNLRLSGTPLRVTGHAGIRRLGPLQVAWSQ